MTEALHDVARIGHAELLTPKADESLRFFVDVLGMEEEAREGQSVYLRGWGDYLRYSLKLTESPQAGLGHMALRAWSPEALERRVAAIEEAGLGTGWIDGDVGSRACVPLHRSGRPCVRALLRGGALRAARPSEAVVAEPATALCGARCGRQAARPRERAGGGRAREPRLRGGGPRLPPLREDRARRRHRGRRLAEPLDRGPRAHLRRRRARRSRPPSPPRVLGGHARGVPPRRRPVRRQRGSDRGCALEARCRAGVLPLRLRAGREPDRGDDGGLLRVRPGLRADRLDVGGARARPVLGRADDRELPHVRHAGRGGEASDRPRALRDPALRQGRARGSGASRARVADGDAPRRRTRSTTRSTSHLACAGSGTP